MDCIIALFAAFGFVRFVVVLCEMFLDDEREPEWRKGYSPPPVENVKKPPPPPMPPPKRCT
jgi:hypothetical protein